MRLSWQQIPSPVVSEILCNSGLDGVVLDTEHGFYNNETLYNCIQIIRALNKTCYVRVTETNKSLVRSCLDAEANGIILSSVETVEQCRKIHEMSKYPSKGGKRGLGLVRQNKWGMESLDSDSPHIIAQIETKEGINNLEKIVSYGFDFYMIGPYDLSASLGKPGNFNSDEYLQSLRKINNIIPTSKLAVHIPNDIKKQIKKYDNYGIIAVGMDTIGLLEFYKKIEV